MREGWGIRKLGDILIFDKRFNGLPKGQQGEIAHFHHVSAEELKSLKVDEGNVKLISTGQFDGYTTEELAGSKLNRGEIITIPTGGVANIKYYTGLFVDSGNLIGIARDKSISLKYVYYGMISKKEVINSYYRGVSIKHPFMPDICKITLPIPSVQEQEKVAAEFDCLTDIIDKKKLQLGELDKLARSIFSKMFGNPVDNEKSWTKHRFGDFGEVIGGFAFQSNSFTPSGLPVLKIGNINSGVLRTKDLCFFPETDKLVKYIVRPNDIVMSLTGTTGKDDYGNVCIIPEVFPKYYLNQRNARLETKGAWKNVFLKYFFENPKVKSILTGISRGVRQANILNKDILDLPVILPPISLQNDFAQKVEAIEKQKELVKRSIVETETLFNSRMDYWFN